MDTSPRLVARLGGLAYVVEAAFSVFGQIWVPGVIVVAGNAAATATNLLGNETLYRLAITSSLLATAAHVAETVLLYAVFRRVSRIGSLLFLSVALIAVSLHALSSVVQIAPLITLTTPDGAGLSQGELQGLAYVFLRLRLQAFNTYIVFFGFRCAAVGYLIWRSTFMPRVIGPLMILAGIGYLTLLWPPFANAVQPFNLALAGPGEISLIGWLLIRGVDPERWRRQASRAVGVANP